MKLNLVLKLLPKKSTKKINPLAILVYYFSAARRGSRPRSILRLQVLVQGLLLKVYNILISQILLNPYPLPELNNYCFEM